MNRSWQAKSRARCHAVTALALAAGMLALLPGAASGAQFEIVAAESSVRVQLFARGLLSVFAHDHLLVADGMAGRVVFDPQSPPESGVQLSVPVASLIVDDPGLREEEGLDGTFSGDDIAEIRETMLGDQFLDAERYPRVIVTATEVTGEPPILNVALSVRIKDQERIVHVPTQVEVNGRRLLARGELFLNQTDFGIEPFSSYLGTVAVEDAVRVRFKIVAQQQ